MHSDRKADLRNEITDGTTTPVLHGEAMHGDRIDSVINVVKGDIQVEVNGNGIKPGKKISRSGSYGPDSEIVKTIIDQHKRGCPIALYELMQGMVDYGKGNEPPPRVWLEYKSGKRVVFDGYHVEQSESDPLLAIEFTNTGVSLRPEDTVIDRHGGGNDTLGTHGHGMTAAITYFALRGMPVTIRSHYKGLAWSGRVELHPTDTEVTTVSHIEGEFGEPTESELTAFRVETPSDDLCKNLENISEYFLYANPKYRYATVVDKDPEANTKKYKTISVNCGKILCIKGIVNEQNRYNYIFVDGLRVKTQIPSILPWAIHDLGRAKEYEYHVRRSTDSTGYEGFRLPEILNETIDKIEDESLLRILIVTAANNPKDTFLEFKSSFKKHNKMSETTKSLIRKIWNEDFEDALIEFDPHAVSKYEKKGGEKKKVRLVPALLYSFLADAGVRTLWQETGEKDAVSFGNLAKLQIPSARASNGMDRFVERVASENGEVEIIVIDGKKYLQIAMPHVIENFEQLNGQTVENPAGICVRICAILAGLRKLDCEIFSISGGEVRKISVNFEEPADNCFATKVEMETLRQGKFPRYSLFGPNKTYILLSGGSVDEAKIITYFEELVRQYAEKIEDVKRRVRVAKKTMGKLDSMPSAADAGEKALVIRSKASLGIGQKDRRDTDRACTKEEQEERVISIGCHCDDVGSSFEYDAVGQCARWRNDYEWIEVKIPRGAPSSFNSRIVFSDVRGGCTIPVISEGKILAYSTDPVNAQIEFFRDARTGIYSFRGNAKKLTYYTDFDEDTYYREFPPLDCEKEDIIARDFLLPHWKQFFSEIEKNPAYSVFNKVALAQKKWAETFVYSDDPGLNDQVKGKSREVIAAKILNTSRGICNLSATGFALLLRTIGIPSRVCGGYLKQNQGSGGSHMWVEYWNGKCWVVHESEVGISSVPDILPSHPHPIEDERFLNTARTSDNLIASRFTPDDRQLIIKASEVAQELKDMYEEIAWVDPTRKSFFDRLEVFAASLDPIGMDSMPKINPGALEISTAAKKLVDDLTPTAAEMEAKGEHSMKKFAVAIRVFIDALMAIHQYALVASTEQDQPGKTDFFRLADNLIEARRAVNNFLPDVDAKDAASLDRIQIVIRARMKINQQMRGDPLELEQLDRIEKSVACIQAACYHFNLNEAERIIPKTLLGNGGFFDHVRRFFLSLNPALPKSDTANPAAIAISTIVEQLFYELERVQLEPDTEFSAHVKEFIETIIYIDHCVKVSSNDRDFNKFADVFESLKQAVEAYHALNAFASGDSGMKSLDLDRKNEILFVLLKIGHCMEPDSLRLFDYAEQYVENLRKLRNRWTDFFYNKRSR